MIDDRRAPVAICCRGFLSTYGKTMDIFEIHDRLKVVGEDSETPVDILAAIIAKLPDDVADWTLRNVWFQCPPDSNGVAFTVMVPPPVDEDFTILRVVYIAPRVWNEADGEQNRIIAHEIAHHWLRHDGPAAGGADYDRRESEVEAMLREWGISA